MRIIQVVNVRWFNATAWYGLYLGRLLKQAGHEVLILALPGSEPAPKAQKWGLELLEINLNTQTPLGLAALFLKLKKLIKDFRPNIVNCHRGESFILWGLLRSRYDFALIRTRGDQRLPKANMINIWLHRQVADAVISTNSDMTRHFRHKFKLGSDKLFQIIGGVDDKRFQFNIEGRNKIRQELGLNQKNFAVGLLGRFDRVKGQKEAIEAVSRLYHQGYKQIRLILLGFDSALSTQEIQVWIEEFQAQEAVIITGYRQDIVDCISALDLGLIASLWSETIARAALEIMACKIPLISTRVGVMPDLLSSESLVEPGNIEQTEQKIQQCLQNSAFMTSIQQKQQQQISMLSSTNFLKNSLTIYEQKLP